MLLSVVLLLFVQPGFLAVTCAQMAGNTPNFSKVLSTRQSKEQLGLSTDIVDQKYCGDGNLQIFLQLHFTNTGDQPLILYKYPHLMVNPFGMPGPLDGVIPDNSVYIILKAGETFDVKTDLHLLIQNGRTEDRDDFLAAGHHVLQIKVRTWYGSRELATKMRQQWSQYGFLWTEPKTSSPMPFIIDGDSPIMKCSQIIDDSKQ
jgi:hypothetical protein